MNASPAPLCFGWVMWSGFRLECGNRTRNPNGFCGRHQHQVGTAEAAKDRITEGRPLEADTP